MKQVLFTSSLDLNLAVVSVTRRFVDSIFNLPLSLKSTKKRDGILLVFRKYKKKTRKFTFFRVSAIGRTYAATL
jgi:hypothetical protein